MIQAAKLEEILKQIAETKATSVQSVDILIEVGFELAAWIAFSGQQKAEAKRDLHKKRHAAMISLAGSLKANAAALSATMQRDFINDVCYEENYALELADRCNSTCIHTLDFIRSCMSSLKAERQYASQPGI